MKINFSVIISFDAYILLIIAPANAVYFIKSLHLFIILGLFYFYKLN